MWGWWGVEDVSLGWGGRDPIPCRCRLAIVLGLEQHPQPLLVRRVQAPRAGLEPQVPIKRDQNDMARVCRYRSRISPGVDEGEATREVVLLPRDGAEDDVVHAPREVVREPVDGAGKVDRLGSDAEVLEVVATRSLDFEVSRALLDRRFEVCDGVFGGDAEGCRVLLEPVELRDDCEGGGSALGHGRKGRGRGLTC